MSRKIFRETKMQGGNIYRPSKKKENTLAIWKDKQKPFKEQTLMWKPFLEE